MDAEKVRRRKRELVPVYGVVNPQKCRVLGKNIGAAIGVVVRKENRSWILNY